MVLDKRESWSLIKGGVRFSEEERRNFVFAISEQLRLSLLEKGGPVLWSKNRKKSLSKSAKINAAG